MADRDRLACDGVSRRRLSDPRRSSDAARRIRTCSRLSSDAGLQTRIPSDPPVLDGRATQVSRPPHALRGMNTASTIEPIRGLNTVLQRAADPSP